MTHETDRHPNAHEALAPDPHSAPTAAERRTVKVEMSGTLWKGRVRLIGDIDGVTVQFDGVLERDDRVSGVAEIVMVALDQTPAPTGGASWTLPHTLPPSRGLLKGGPTDPPEQNDGHGGPDPPFFDHLAPC